MPEPGDLGWLTAHPARRARQAVLPAAAAAEVGKPQQGLVLEAAEVGASTGPGLVRRANFGQGEGPLAAYRRTVELTPLPDGRCQVDQVVEGRLGLPWWSWLLSPLVWRQLGKLGDQRGSRYLPWWAPPERLDRRSALVMANLAALVAVQGLVAGLLPITLSYASSEMRVGTLGQGVVFGAVELSALPALAALIVADRRGRRGVILWATAGAVVLSEISGLSPGVRWLAGAQVGVGALVAAAGIAATVVAVEEVPKGCRAWALGVLGLAGGFGAGIPLALLPLAGVGTGGWRWLFWLSVACLPVVVAAGRRLPESKRWVLDEGALARESRGRAGAFPRERCPQGRAFPRERWLVLVCAGAALLAMFATPAAEFETQFLRHQRHYSAFSISVLEQLAGTIGALGVLFGGRLADTHGRRPVAALAVTGATAATLVAYFTHSGTMWTATIIAQFFLYATGPALGVYGVELFSTSSRGRSAGLVAASAAVGGVLGTVVTGALAGGHTLGPPLALMALGPAALVVLLVTAYPETAAVELEELS